MSPDSYHSIEGAVRGCFGQNVIIEHGQSIGGGDINSAKLLMLSNGESVFLKYNIAANRSFFDAEEEGLAAIADTGVIKTPRLFCKGTDETEKISFLMMERIVSGPPRRDTWYEMGRQYAAMHLSDTSGYVKGGRFGFLHDNYIGATKQINTPMDSWVDFFRECRLMPQFEMAQRAFDKQMNKDMIRLLDRLDDILTEPEKPSLLHGDMWGGNHLIDRNGDAVLIDPAAYVGHPEADIAMTELFGRMPYGFYEGYYEKIPMQAGYDDRRDLYNLYHILNHYNLFGGSYLHSAYSIIRHYI